MSQTELYSEEIISTIKKHTSLMIPFPTEVKKKTFLINDIKAIFFDVYGTMLISGTGDIGIAEEKNNYFPISEILLNYSFVLVSGQEIVDDIFSQLITKFIKEEHRVKKAKGILFPEVDIIEIWIQVISRLLNENFISGEYDRNKIQLMALTYECMINPVWPMKGLNSLLNCLYKKDVILGIISNAQFYTPAILNTLIDFKIGKDAFDPDLLFYSYLQKEAKPSEDFFLKAVTKIKKMYNIDPEEILYLGNDMLNDIYTAYQCGCKTALFAGDKRSLRLRLSDTRCKDLEPDLIITDLKQLIEIL